MLGQPAVCPYVTGFSHGSFCTDFASLVLPTIFYSVLSSSWHAESSMWIAIYKYSGTCGWKVILNLPAVFHQLAGTPSLFFFLLFFSSALFKVFLLPSCHLWFTTVNICVPRLAVFDQWQQFKKCWRLIALSNSSSKMLWNEFTRVWMEIPDCESEGIDLDSNMEVHKRWK